MSNIPKWLPDWKDEQAYPAAGKKTTDTQWAWEFLRRNEGYQKAYDNLLEDLEEFKRREWKHDATLSAEDLESAHAYLSFHIDKIIDPATIFDITVAEALIGPKRQVLINFGTDDPNRDMPRIFLPEFVAAIRFSLFDDLEIQWKLAKEHLRQRISQLRNEGKLSQPTITKSHRKNFAIYLRVLDAFTDGAKPSEIAKQILRKSKAHSSDITKIAQYKKAASGLVQQGYRTLLTNL